MLNSRRRRPICFCLMGLRLEHTNKLKAIKGVGFITKVSSLRGFETALLWTYSDFKLSVNPSLHGGPLSLVFCSDIINDEQMQQSSLCNACCSVRGSINNTTITI